MFEQSLWRENPEDPTDTQGIVLVLQYGHADGDIAEAEHHAACGLMWQGLFAGRDDDTTGLYVSFVDLVEDAGYAENETAIELFHRFQITPFFAVEPDLQYIVDSGGAEEDVLVATLRIELIF